MKKKQEQKKTNLKQKESNGFEMKEEVPNIYFSLKMWSASRLVYSKLTVS